MSAFSILSPSFSFFLTLAQSHRQEQMHSNVCTLSLSLSLSLSHTHTHKDAAPNTHTQTHTHTPHTHKDTAPNAHSRTQSFNSPSLFISHYFGFLNTPKSLLALFLSQYDRDNFLILLHLPKKKLFDRVASILLFVLFFVAFFLLPIDSSFHIFTTFISLRLYLLQFLSLSSFFLNLFYDLNSFPPSPFLDVIMA